MVRLTVLGSGSSGNCAVVSTGRTTLLIDAGLSAKQICLRLEAAGIAPAPPEEFLGLRRVAQGDPRALPQPPARRANPFAVGIANSAFFYVRRFTGGGGGDRYVVVTCRMAGGGARMRILPGK